MHIKFIKISVLLISLNIAACQNSYKKYLPEEVYRKLLVNCPDATSKELEIYYMDGNCSFCIAKAVKIDYIVSQKPNTKAIFVAISDNSLLTKYYFKEKNIKSCLILNNDSILKNSNINFNEVVIIAKDRSITIVNDDKLY